MKKNIITIEAGSFDIVTGFKKSAKKEMLKYYNKETGVDADKDDFTYEKVYTHIKDEEDWYTIDEEKCEACGSKRKGFYAWVLRW